jgi:hypothetical protein
MRVRLFRPETVVRRVRTNTESGAFAGFDREVVSPRAELQGPHTLKGVPGNLTLTSTLLDNPFEGLVLTLHTDITGHQRPMLLDATTRQPLAIGDDETGLYLGVWQMDTPVVLAPVLNG